MYDLPALVDHVCQETGYDKIAFMGHSQGNGLTFISLSLGMVPNLGKKLSVFIALAPAVYAGPLTTGFPFTTLKKIEWPTWKRLFGTLDFIPLMRYAYDYCPAQIFGSLGYIMFAFLFSWTDANWLKRRKTKMFRFTPTPVSSASIFWWCGKGGFADRQCTLDDSLDRWYDDRFPPLSIYYGGRDYLVLTEPLLERLKEKETDVNVIKVTKIDKSEHCDFYWAAEAVEWAFESFVGKSGQHRWPRWIIAHSFPPR
jgi:pimeloyl-ACP methyl ester carboxylesterase